MRLRPLTEDRPKSVVPVLNRPAMEHTFAYLKQFGIEDIILALNYLPEVIKGHFGDGDRSGVRLTYCIEKEPLGTAGAVKNVEEHLDGTFFVLNGDVFTALDLGKMLAFHRKNKAKATISLTWVDDPSAFGVVETDNKHKVKRFIEKPPLAEATTHWINAGTYVLEPEMLKYAPVNTNYMFEKGLFPTILTAGEPVYGFPYKGYWLDMGTPGHYFSLNVDMLTAKIKSAVVGVDCDNGAHFGDDVEIDRNAEVTAPVLFDKGCGIARGVKVKGPVVMGKNCRVEVGASVENAILWDNVSIREGARVTDSIIGSGVDIAPGRTVNGKVITLNSEAPLLR